MKLSELKVGDKFRIINAGAHDEPRVVTDIRTRIDGRVEMLYWSDALGFSIAFQENTMNVELITEPAYKPYSDLRPLIGKVLMRKGRDVVFVVVWASVAEIIVGSEIGYITGKSAKYIFDNYTHLDGTPCGELMQ